jgi:hypothetical protein
MGQRAHLSIPGCHWSHPVVTTAPGHPALLRLGVCSQVTEFPWYLL